MSYCRFSSEEFRSDVYVWCGEKYMVQVAKKRRDLDRSDLPPKPDEDDEDFTQKHVNRHAKLIRMLDQADTNVIGGPYDGETFSVSTPGEAADILEEVEEAGYYVPDHVIPILREEQAQD